MSMILFSVVTCTPNDTRNGKENSFTVIIPSLLSKTQNNCDYDIAKRKRKRKKKTLKIFLFCPIIGIISVSKTWYLAQLTSLT